jgi:thymidylate synthase
MLESPGPVLVEIMDPRRRVLNIPFRNNSLPAVCAETIWVLAGRTDIEWLSFYLPRAADYSDDGKTWRAGYGPRLRKWGTAEACAYDNSWRDQIAFVINKLKKSTGDRQAVITLLDPAEDQRPDLKTKDFPCTQSLSFMVRDGMLDLTVFIRSNDLIFGWSGVNAFEFSVLLEVVASILDLPVGPLYIMSNNLHVYETHFKTLINIAGLDEAPAVYRHWKAQRYMRITSLEQLDTELDSLFGLEPYIDDGTLDIDEFEKMYQKESHMISLIDDMITVVLAYRAFKIGRIQLAARIRNFIVDPAMQESYDRHIAWELRSRSDKK